MKDYTEAWDRDHGCVCGRCGQRITAARRTMIETGEILDTSQPPPMSQEAIELLFDKIRADLAQRPPVP